MKNKEYYMNALVINNVLNSMRFRNNAFLNVTGDFKYNVQNVIVSNISNLLKNFLRFKFFDRNYNLYSSVARYNFSSFYDKYNFPPFSFKLFERKQQGELFNNNHEDYILSYDFVMDFDDHNDFKKTYSEVNYVKTELDFFKVPYILRFSGRGFHIIIPYKFLPEWFDKCKLTHYRHVSTVIKTLYNLSSLDLAIYDGRRVIKTAYSIDNRSGYVCLPLTDLEFKQFNKSYCLPENVLRIPDLFNRNSVLRIGDEKGFEKFLKKRCDIDGSKLFN